MITTLGRILAIALLGLPTFVVSAGVDRLIRHLESVSTSESHAYRLRDDKRRPMDCLKLFQAGDDQYMGLYHTLRKGVFSIHLAHSTDLLHWAHVKSLDAHASQPTIWQCDNGAYFLAYEKDAPNSCWIRLRYYDDLANLCDGDFKRQFDIPRTLAPTAEGTPSFESVRLTENMLGKSEIRIRFHYYKDAHVDRLAKGTLTNFESWRAECSEQINAELEKRGSTGNFGDRDKFMWNGKSFYLQEVQHRRGDWSSWRVFLCDDRGMPIKRLSINTHSESTAFANPTATWVTDSMGRGKLVVTLFLPSEGNSPKEAGELIYVIDPYREMKDGYDESGTEGNR